MTHRKNTKKTVSWLLLLAMLIQMLTLPAFAGAAVPLYMLIELDQDILEPGDTFEAVYGLSNIQSYDFQEITLDFRYNSSALELLQIDEVSSQISGQMPNYTNNPGVLQFSLATESGNFEVVDGELLVFKFRVKDSATPGQYSFEVDATAFDSQGFAIDIVNIYDPSPLGEFTVNELVIDLNEINIILQTPVAGEQAQVQVSGEGYTANVAWLLTSIVNQPHDPNTPPPLITQFEADTEYTAFIELSILDGYKAYTSTVVTVNGLAPVMVYPQGATPTEFVIRVDYTSPQQALQGMPIISNSSQIAFGDQITAVDGITSTSPGAITFQWLRDGAPVVNSNAYHYTVTADDIGHVLQVEVSAQNYTGSIISAETSTVLKAQYDTLVEPPILVADQDTITVSNTQPHQEYAVYLADDTTPLPNWTASGQFTGLHANRLYTVVTRGAETSTHFASGVLSEQISTAPLTQTITGPTALSVHTNSDLDLAVYFSSNANLATLSFQLVSDTSSNASLAGTVITTGQAEGQLIILVSAQAVGDYAVATHTLSVSVSNKPTQVFKDDFSDSVNKVYGDAAFTKKATLSTGNGVLTYQSSAPTIASIDATTGLVTIHQPGVVTITAQAAQTEQYAVTQVQYQLTISKADLVLKASSHTIKTGEALPQPQVIYEGVIDADRALLDQIIKLESGDLALIIKSTDGEQALTTSAKAGTYTIDFANAPIFKTVTNYQLSTASGQLIIEQSGTNQQPNNTTPKAQKETETTLEQENTTPNNQQKTVATANGSTLTLAETIAPNQAGDIVIPVEQNAKVTLANGMIIPLPGGSKVAKDGSIVLGGDSSVVVELTNRTRLKLTSGSTINADQSITIATAGESMIQVGDNIQLQLQPQTTIMRDESALGYQVLTNANFEDVAVDDWYASAAAFSSAHGILQGTNAETPTFSPQQPTNRAMLVTVLYRLAGDNTSAPSQATFADVDQNAYYSDSVSWATGNGIINGYGDGEFGSDDELTREQLATVISRFVKSVNPQIASTKLEESAFADYQSISDYSKESVSFCVENGLMQGKPGSLFDPKGTATRAELAEIMKRLINYFAQ